MAMSLNDNETLNRIESYRVALKDLNFNSKPIITGLTVKAQESTFIAPSITNIISSHIISEPNPAAKLPCLYLIDSIVKNLGEPWISLFSERISDLFCTVYGQINDERTRIEFLRVFGLWWGVFPEVPLKDIEARLRLKRAPSRHSAQYLPYPPSNTHLPYPPTPHIPHSPMIHSNRLSQSTIGLLSQLQAIIMAPSTAFPPNSIADLIYRLGTVGELDPNVLRDIDFNCRHPDKRPALDIINHVLYPPLPQNHIIPISVNPNPSTSPKPNSNSKPHQALYDSLPHQCKMCGIRFDSSDSSKSAYASHLDAHFKRNMRMRDKAKKIITRDWLSTAEDWIHGRSAASLANSSNAVPMFFDAPPNKPLLDAKKRSEREREDKDEDVVNAGDDRDQKCPLCNESFDLFYNDETEEWMFRGVIVKDDVIYHISCLGDQIDGKRAKK